MTDRNKWIIFDAWGVVYTVGDDIKSLLLPWLARRGVHVSSERADQLYRPASTGKLPLAEFWRGLGVGEDWPQVQREYLLSAPEMEPHFKPVAEQLAQRYSLAMLSNCIPEWSLALRRRFGVDGLFRHAVISGDPQVQVRKPHPRAFEELRRRIAAAPEDCVFVDDRPKNLRVAGEIGFRTVRFLRERYEDESPADAEITSFLQLPAAVDALLGD